MRVKFLEDVSVLVSDSIESPTFGELFIEDDECDFEMMESPLKWTPEGFVESVDYVNVRFIDGSMAFGIPKSSYKVLDE